MSEGMESTGIRSSLPIRVRASRILVRANRFTYTSLCEGSRKGDLNEHCEQSFEHSRKLPRTLLTDSMTAPVVGS